MPAPTSSSGIIKPIPITEKRQSSIISLGSIFPRRKSLQTTALATRRQSLWINLSKNAASSTSPPPLLLPLAQDHSSLLRKKILRLLLVFSYLLSISIFGIALATFYGLFWSGYSSPQTTNIVDILITTPSSSSSSFPSNKTSQTEHVSWEMNQSIMFYSWHICLCLLSTEFIARTSVLTWQQSVRISMKSCIDRFEIVECVFFSVDCSQRRKG